MNSPDVVMAPISARVARTVRQVRVMRGLTQEDLARKLGIPRATLAGVEAEYRKHISVDQLQAFADALDVSAQSLFTGEIAIEIEQAKAREMRHQATRLAEEAAMLAAAAEQIERNATNGTLS